MKKLQRSATSPREHGPTDASEPKNNAIKPDAIVQSEEQIDDEEETRELS
jgi:hypothetical protein